LPQPKLDLPTPVDTITFHDIPLLIKRDDLIACEFSGNKARKLYAYFKQNIQTPIVSYGSNQSNAMYSLSALAKLKSVEFVYFTHHIPSYLKQNPIGNYHEALKNGMQIFESDEPEQSAQNHDGVYIPEGGASSMAEEGVKLLANEIIEYAAEHRIGDLNIFLPSGTGTTALYLQKHLPFKVYTTECVGDAAYLKKQFSLLEQDEQYHPTILSLKKKYHFGKLYKELYDIWLQLRKSTDIEFEMLYDPKGFLTVAHHREEFSNHLMYIHGGGLQGNSSMLKRYQRRYG
jgi:1-aminocyclopropane-1-carboxylate deaminase/D-cysteine desulfhydrase-like pyridoxal-dependent ACC family enzyme